MFPRNYWEDPDPLGLDADSAEDDRPDEPDYCEHGQMVGQCEDCVHEATEVILADLKRGIETWQKR